ncbi:MULTISPECIES: M23 family metallopeptidase [Myxococcus]|uniref:M23 family metallopeptidase n=1 Tax=Myxococcus llanfairpwllgwyngyllgogerychwyrndrobwllllantysiliogogogochensis TaxID=2590453 RepID=A0A540WV44_9BACT|nr:MULTISPECIES: M23 family metallopeptidase [Myxococcus]NTX00534.1 M23 family metallopeptidase [Myxococcus sp. CA040A]NTX12763.1 M23 family metallopeptidase [Myxococcus sp. CA056]NTX33782.1 M23 family metallopeptidase [Myxococcus sp. CA033]NTX49847.1 M23 family metallopeptidase [Myxococcus sp. CA039A]TQF12888.1 M23 family metallopeptidase [Myxococcus llanfairpwllgwyngyllgogerychwyrndrobwllllantysiliogogogochensis]
MRLAPLFALAALLTVSSASEAAVRYDIKNRRIEPRQTLAGALHEAQLPDAQVTAVISALEGVFDFRKSRVGDQFRIVLRDGELDFFDYRQSLVDEWQVRRDGEKYVGSKRSIEVEKQVSVVSLEIQTSLYEAAVDAGEDPAIGMVLADVFAWDIDFYRDVRKGDTARALVEKFVSKGRVLRYGEVLAAQYVGGLVGPKKVYRYVLPDGQPNYFQEDGASAKKTFLKSPLKYAHVTSKFGSRFHPVLQYLKNHNGVDYGTPIGTPVWAVADGTVTQAGWAGAAGNMVVLRHANGFETQYMHLSKVGEGVRVGARVSQKQVIAYSGNTGRSTGPHLHFGMKRGGGYTNPLNQQFPRADPLPKTLLPDFLAKAQELAGQMEAVSVAAVAGQAPAAP